MKNKLTTSIILILVSVLSAFSQANVNVYRAELSVPFGEAKGKIIVAGEQMIFVDDEKPEFSFAISRSNISAVTGDDKILTVETIQSFADRSGSKNRFVARVFDNGAEKLEKWLKGDSQYDSRKTSYSNTGVSMGSNLIFEAKHDHRLYGSCAGRLIVGDDRISYESSDEREHSRQWLFADIKKIKRSSPYKFEVKLFKSDGYTLEMLGKGIDITDFKTMENRLALAKSDR